MRRVPRARHAAASRCGKSALTRIAGSGSSTACLTMPMQLTTTSACVWSSARAIVRGSSARTPGTMRSASTTSVTGPAASSDLTLA